MLFAGCLGRNAPHSHSTSVLLAGIYDRFDLKVGAAGWLRCRTAVIRAGVPYEFDAGGRPFAVIYIEPNATSAEGLVALISETREVSGAIVGEDGELSVIRALYEDAQSADWAGLAIEDLVGFARRKARRTTDLRVAYTINSLTSKTTIEVDSWSSNLPRVRLAALAVGLSTSRFQHVFKNEVGVSYRRYLAWLRMRAAIRDVVEGSTLAMAAHGAGYCDQPHFAREFRRIFGAPASRSLLRVRG
jgi:AraC-like DNA-binding protein